MVKDGRANFRISKADILKKIRRGTLAEMLALCMKFIFNIDDKGYGYRIKHFRPITFEERVSHTASVVEVEIVKFKVSFKMNQVKHLSEIGRLEKFELLERFCPPQSGLL